MIDTSQLSKGERTRQAIVDASHDLFLEQGYTATSMRQIAGRAGIALGGIYNHFTSKDEIFQALIIDQHPYLRIFPLLLQVPGKTAEEFVHNAAPLIQDELDHSPDFMKLVFVEIVEFGGKHFPRLYEIIYPHALPVLQRFTSPGSAVRPLPAPVILRTFLGAIIAYYVTESLMSDSSLPVELRGSSLADFLDIYLHGILEHQELES